MHIIPLSYKSVRWYIFSSVSLRCKGDPGAGPNKTISHTYVCTPFRTSAPNLHYCWIISMEKYTMHTFMILCTLFTHPVTKIHGVYGSDFIFAWFLNTTRNKNKHPFMNDDLYEMNVTLTTNMTEISILISVHKNIAHVSQLKLNSDLIISITRLVSGDKQPFLNRPFQWVVLPTPASGRMQ